MSAGGKFTRNFSLRLNISFEIRFDELKPLFDTAFNISTSLCNISKDCSFWVSKMQVSQLGEFYFSLIDMYLRQLHKISKAKFSRGIQTK